jgi:RNA polymerase sigma factor (sigma-70 family)
MTQPLRQPQLLDDERLGRLVTAGNSWAFSVLYERYNGMLYRYCRSILRTDEDAHDAVQSTFTRALEALQRNQRDAPMRPWLFRIAHNEAISAIRGRKARDSLAALTGPHRISAADRSHAREELGVLVADLRQLPEQPRTAILMRELVGLSHAEIAVVQGTSATRVKHAIFEARRALAEFARGRQMECGDVRRVVAEGDRRVLRSRRICAHLRDCAECARFAAAKLGRTRDLGALLPAGWAVGEKLLARTPRPGWSTGVHDRALAAGVLGTAGSKLTGMLTIKAAIVAAGVTVAGAATGRFAYDWDQRTGPVATPSSLAPLMSPARGTGDRADAIRAIHGGAGSLALPSANRVSPRSQLMSLARGGLQSRFAADANRSAPSDGSHRTAKVIPAGRAGALPTHASSSATGQVVRGQRRGDPAMSVLGKRRPPASSRGADHVSATRGSGRSSAPRGTDRASPTHGAGRSSAPRGTDRASPTQGAGHDSATHGADHISPARGGVSHPAESRTSGPAGGQVDAAGSGSGAGGDQPKGGASNRGSAASAQQRGSPRIDPPPAAPPNAHSSLPSSPNSAAAGGAADPVPPAGPTVGRLGTAGPRGLR